jgi:hypothetical protein
MAVEYLRSCYSTKARFYAGDSTQDDIEWYFVEDDTPFIPNPFAVTSLNWAKGDWTDDGGVGEVVGAPRPWSSGARMINADASAYCGSAEDWQGLGTRPTDPVQLDMFGQPSCCGGPSPAIAVDIGVQFQILDSVPTWLAMWGDLTRFSNWPFNWLANGLEVPQPYLPWSIDLFWDFPNSSGTGDFISDYSICDFPGYATQQLYATVIDPGAYFTEQTENDFLWTNEGSFPFSVTPAPNCPVGAVIYDASGIVMAANLPVGSAFQFLNPGDYLEIAIIMGGNAEVP